MGTVVVLAVAGALNYYCRSQERNRSYADPWQTYMIGMGQARFHGVVEMIPPEAVLGYVSDLPDLFSNVPSRLSAVWSAEAWYALAPRLVIPHENPKNQDWILGNFHRPFDLAQIETENRVKLVRDFGSGVVVFKHR